MIIRTTSVLALATDELSYQTGSSVLVGGEPFEGAVMNVPPGFPADLPSTTSGANQ